MHAAYKYFDTGRGVPGQVCVRSSPAPPRLLTLSSISLSSFAIPPAQGSSCLLFRLLHTLLSLTHSVTLHHEYSPLKPSLHPPPRLYISCLVLFFPVRSVVGTFLW
mmetsp:Transcript_41106/g.99696  ORF Transcript_41106/g.99696 Transcript_41106/m.99696 type:complete len:106 (+) Transcript_41106:82-399(+)